MSVQIEHILRENEIKEFIEMVMAFYIEDQEGFGDSFMTKDKILNTIEQARNHPDQLKIRLLRAENDIVGYAIITSYWSNEYGGLVAILDELYVKPVARSQGISSRFINDLNSDSRYIMVQLEVFKENPRAKNLYEKHGFEIIDRYFMKK